MDLDSNTLHHIDKIIYWLNRARQLPRKAQYAKQKIKYSVEKIKYNLGLTDNQNAEQFIKHLVLEHSSQQLLSNDVEIADIEPPKAITHQNQVKKSKINKKSAKEKMREKMNKMIEENEGS